MAWTGHLGRLRSRGARRGFGDALYAIAALWLSAFITYLVYLLLPFEYLALGLFGLSPIVIIGSALLAGIVALALLVWLVRRLLRPAWRGEAIGGCALGSSLRSPSRPWLSMPAGPTTSSPCRRPTRTIAPSARSVARNTEPSPTRWSGSSIRTGWLSLLSVASSVSSNPN